MPNKANSQARNGRESSPSAPNKPNSQKAEMDVKRYSKMDYENQPALGVKENKPNRGQFQGPPAVTRARLIWVIAAVPISRNGDFLLAGTISEAFNLGVIALRLGGKRLFWDLGIPVDSVSMDAVAAGSTETYGALVLPFPISLRGLLPDNGNIAHSHGSVRKRDGINT